MIGLVGIVLGAGTVGGIVAIIAGGALFAVGLAGTVALAVKIEELVEQINETSSCIDSTKIAIETLSGVTINYADLEDMYGKLNTFWGDLNSISGDIDDHDENIKMQIGMDIFGSTTEIRAAQNSANDLATATKVYLDVLYSQGVELPPPRRDLGGAPVS